MNCELGKHIVPAGWHNWGNEANEKTARYMEYNNSGEGAGKGQRASWSSQLTSKEAKAITLERVFSISSTWMP